MQYEFMKLESHITEEPMLDLSLHPNSPGYRLILNNILVPTNPPRATDSNLNCNTRGDKGYIKLIKKRRRSI